MPLRSDPAVCKYALSSELKLCGSRGLLKQGREAHHHIVKHGHDADVVVRTALLDMYARCGSLPEAVKTFDLAPPHAHDVVSWNALISAYIDQRHGFFALEIFFDMCRSGRVTPSKASFLLALKACSIEESIAYGRHVHDCILRRGLKLDEVYGCSLIDMYAKCGCIDDASKVFCMHSHRNVFPWGALMAGYVRHGLGAKALELFASMHRHGIEPNVVIFSCVLTACGSIRALEEGRQIHNQIIENDLNSDLVLNNALIDMYAKCSEFEEAWKVMHGVSAQDQSERSWGAIIGGCVQHERFNMALQLFAAMQKRTVQLNEIIWSCVLKACGSVGAMNEGRVLHDQILKGNLCSNVGVLNGIIGMYASSGCLMDAQKAFDTLPERNPSSWDAIVSGYMQHGHEDIALGLFERACNENVQLNGGILSCAVKACAKREDCVNGRWIHDRIVKTHLVPDVVVLNSLIDMYLSCGSLDEGRRVFESFSSNRDVVSWNSIMGGYVQFGHEHSAISLFYRMLLSGLRPDRVTYLCMLKACGGAGALTQGRFIYGQIVENMCEIDVAVRVALVDMFARCGSLEEARKLLQGPARDEVACWAALIAGYAQHGQCKEARECFYAMEKNGLKPDLTTFTVVLAACCHAGQVDEGYWYFNSMKEKYGLSPKVEHFNCLVDLLGRAGKLHEAGQLLRNMQDVPGIIMGWMSLLTACRKYGERELGPECFREILHIDPENRAAFTLMSNIFQDVQMWDEAAEVERLRACANAWKKHATAWIQIDGAMHEFVVGERDSPQHAGINSRLKALKHHMAELGYVPRLDIASDAVDAKKGPLASCTL